MDVKSCTESVVAHATAHIDTTTTYTEATKVCKATMMAHTATIVARTVGAIPQMYHFETAVTTTEKKRSFFCTNYYFQALPY